MIRGLFLVLVFIVVLIGALIAFVPLGFAINQSGIAQSGVGWTQIQGTMLNGRINGMHVSGQEIGDVELKLRPLSLLSMTPEYDVQWGSSGGRGTGTIKLSQNRLEANSVLLQQQISSIQALTPSARAVGGTVRLTDGEIRLTRNGCEDASGNLTTDALSKIAVQYGREFGAVSGPLSCRDGNIHIDLAGSSQRGDKITINAHSSLTGAARFDAWVETTDIEVSFALPQIGFIPEDEKWHYYYYQDGGFIQ